MSETPSEEQVDPALQALLDEAIASENQQIDAAVREHLQRRVVSTNVQIRQAYATIESLQTIIADLRQENDNLKNGRPKQPADRQPPRKRTTAKKTASVTPIKKES